MPSELRTVARGPAFFTLVENAMEYPTPVFCMFFEIQSFQNPRLRERFK